MVYKILFIPHLLGWRDPNDTGFFHVVRDVALANELLKQRPSLNIKFVLPRGFRSQFVEDNRFNVIKVPPVTFYSRVVEFHMLFDLIYQKISELDIDLIIGDMFAYACVIADMLEKHCILIADYIFPRRSANILARFCARRASLIIVCDTELHWPLPPLLRSIKDRLYFTGPILRPFDHLLSKSKSDVKRELGIDPNKFLLLVTMGGSGLFREPFKVAVKAFKIVKKHLPSTIMILCTGRVLEEKILPEREVPNGLIIKRFVSDLAPYIRASDIIITRGGHGTLMEASILGTPIVATRTTHVTRKREEIYNIRRIMKLGNLIYIPPEHFNPETLARTLIRLLKNPNLRKRMIEAGQKLPKNGREKAARIIIEFLDSHRNKI